MKWQRNLGMRVCRQTPESLVNLIIEVYLQSYRQLGNEKCSYYRYLFLVFTRLHHHKKVGIG